MRTDYLPSIKEGILLEVGFDDTAPNTPCLISSWALEAALASSVQVIDNRAVAVPCYSPAYTFVEKLQTVSTKFRLQQVAASVAPAAQFPKNFLRHYYDLYCVLGHPEELAFIGTPDYEARKRKRFRGGDELNIVRNPAFTLERSRCARALPAQVRGDRQVPFAAILERIAEHIDRP